jgi:hypothetical protein
VTRAMAASVMGVPLRRQDGDGGHVRQLPADRLAAFASSGGPSHPAF